MGLCERHNLKIEHQCFWCGKYLCSECVVRQDGKKAYCQSCARDLFGIMKKVEKAKKQHEESEKKKPYIPEKPKKIKNVEREDKIKYTKSGYFDFSALQKKKNE